MNGIPERYDSCDFCRHFAHFTAKEKNEERNPEMPPDAPRMKNLKVNYVSKYECRAHQMSFLPEYSCIFKKGIGAVRRRPGYCSQIEVFPAIAVKFK